MLDTKEFARRVMASVERYPQPQYMQSVIASSEVDANTFEAVVKHLRTLAEMGYKPEEICLTAIAVLHDMTAEEGG